MHETKNHQITNFKIPQSFGNQRNFQQYTAKLKVPVASAGRVSCFTGHGSFNAVAASWCCAAVGLHFFLLPSDRAVEFDEIFVVCRAGQDRDPADEIINVH